MGIIQRQGIKASVATYLGMAIGAVNLMILFPRLLSPEELGLTRVLISVSVLVSQAALLGAPFALIRFFPFFKNREKKHHGFPALLLVIVAIGFLTAAAAVLLFRHSIEKQFEQRSPLFADHFYWVLPMALLMVMAEMGFYYCRALLKLPIPVFFREVAMRLVQTAAVLLYSQEVIGFEMLIAWFAGSYFFQFLLLAGYIFSLKEFFFFAPIRLEHLVSLRQILRYSLLMFAAVSAGIYAMNIDVILISSMIDLDHAAIYSIAFFIGTIIQIPARNMNMVAASIIAEAWKNNDRAKIQQLYSQTSLTQFIIGGLLLLLIWINIDFLLGFLPPFYSEAKWVIFIIGLGKLLDMITGINGEIINASKHVKVNLYTNLLLIVLSTASNYFLIRSFGIVGAAFANGLSILFYNSLRMIFLYRTYRLQPFSKGTVTSVLLLLVSFLIASLFPSPQNQWLGFVAYSVAALLMFVVPLLLFKISPEINAAISSALISVRRKS
jgi:O-antigen/teichoic acid export membrane protein